MHDEVRLIGKQAIIKDTMPMQERRDKGKKITGIGKQEEI